ncbi:MAG: hypothetical protein AAGD09_26100 [Cyanobacteria bacterium P01_F01_bin.56]
MSQADMVQTTGRFPHVIDVIARPSPTPLALRVVSDFGDERFGMRSEIRYQSSLQRGDEID